MIKDQKDTPIKPLALSNLSRRFVTLGEEQKSTPRINQEHDTATPPVLKKSNTIEKLKEQITEIPAAKRGRGRPPKLDSKSSAERSANYRAKKRGDK